MSKLKWDQSGQKRYETGVDHGVFYRQSGGKYDEGFAWNGLTTVTETPSGAESNKQYADNQVYLNLISAEEFGATVEAFTYPDEFAECDGTAVVAGGIQVGQQPRKAFGMSYRSLVGDDVNGMESSYKLHLIYGALAAPSEKAFATVNDSPEAITFSWELSTTPVYAGETLKPTAILTIPSAKYTPAQMKVLEDILYGTDGSDPRLPLPEEVIGLFEGSVTEVTATAPTYDEATKTLSIPTVTGVTYYIDDEPVSGSVVLAEDTVVTARTDKGFAFAENSDDDWAYDVV